MPFTLAHPVVAIPLKRVINRFSITALVIGSMVPDFEDFFGMHEMQEFAHQWYGILIFDIPAALIGCFVFHNLLKYKLIHNLPAWYRTRFVQALGFNWNNYFFKNNGIVLFSVLTGIASHFFWDGFTHKDGIFVYMIPALSIKIQVLAYAAPVFFMLQVVTSIIGLVFLQNMISNLPQQTASIALKQKDPYYWPTFLLIFLVIITARLLIFPGLNSYLNVVKAVIGAMLYAWILVSLTIKSTNEK